MEIIHLISGPIDDNTYIAANADRHCVIVDAPFGCASKISAAIDSHGLLPPDYIFITHTHWDHIGGLAELKRLYPNAKILVHKQDAPRLSQPVASLGGMDVPIETVAPDIALSADAKVEVGSMVFDVLHTPGHSPGAVCYYNAAADVVFSGDTLFRMSVGRTDFPGSDFATLAHSIKTKLWPLPPQTIVYPGHNASTTIGFEQANNPFLVNQ